MPWLRVGDTVAYDPRVVEVLMHEDADDRTADELFGYVCRLATLAAQHLTDYAVSYATAMQLAGSKSRTDRLLMLAEFSGYGFNEADETGRRRFRLVDDPKFIHMKTAEEDAWEKQRKADNANPHITVPVRARDGDVCRYCWKVVNWGDKIGGIGGTYDHRPPGRPASPHTSVVACRTCNSRRGQAGTGMAPEDALRAADELLPLLEVPSPTLWKPATRTFLEKHRHILDEHGITPPPPAKAKTAPRGGTQWRPVPARDTDTAPRQGVRPAARPDQAPSEPSSATVTPAPQSANASRPKESGSPAQPASRQGQKVNRVGSGRDGTGRAGWGPGRDGPGLDGSPPEAGRPPGTKPRRRRGRRGGRGRNQRSTQGGTSA